jgi:hypothetical protein
VPPTVSNAISMGLNNVMLANVRLVMSSKQAKQHARSASISVLNAVPMTSENASNVVALALKIPKDSVSAVLRGASHARAPQSAPIASQVSSFRALSVLQGLRGRAWKAPPLSAPSASPTTISLRENVCMTQPATVTLRALRAPWVTTFLRVPRVNATFAPQ